MQNSRFAIVVLVAFVAGVFGAYAFSAAGKHETATAKESTYDRVMRTGTIRCGYTSWNPLFYIDPANGEKKGIFHDSMEEVGKRLGFSIVWQEEIGWGSITEAIKSGRVDMACAGYWLNPGRIKNLSSTAAQIYSPLYVYVRQGDTLSYKTIDDLNSPDLTAASIDGSAENQVITKRFPKAKSLMLPETDTNSDELESLVTGKADFIVLDSASAEPYVANNPGKIRELFPDQPATVYPTIMLLPPGDAQFKEMIDDALRSLDYDGTLEGILKNYRMEKVFLHDVKFGDAVNNR